MLKRWLHKQLLNYASRRRQRRVPPGPLRILIVPYGGLGDLAMTLPLLAALREGRPDLVVDVVASPRNAELLAQYPGLNNVYVADINARRLSAWPQWKHVCRSGSWHVVLYLAERCTFPVHWRLQQLQAEAVWALPCRPRRGKPLPDWVSQTVDRWVGDGSEPRFPLRMLSVLNAFGLPLPPQPDFRLHVMPQPHRVPSGDPVVLFHPSGTQSGNALSRERQHQLLATFRTRPWRPAMFERAVRALASADRQHVLSLPSPSLNDVIGWLQVADVVVTTDTAIGHLACALGRPTVILRRNEAWRAACDPVVNQPVILVAPGEDPIDAIDDTAILDAISQLLRRFPPYRER